MIAFLLYRYRDTERDRQMDTLIRDMDGGIQCIITDLFGCLKCEDVFDMTISK